MPTIVSQKLADELTAIACKQLQTGFKFKKKRMEEIRKNEEFYYGRTIKVPRGRFAIPLPTMSAFVSQLMSKIDEPPAVKFGFTDQADLKLAQRCSAAWKKESSATMKKWGQKDRWEKKRACFSGRGISKLFSESDPKYKSHIEVVDDEDFVCEPMGGGDLEKHLFLGQMNVFRTKADLEAGKKNGLYANCDKLIEKTTAKEFKDHEDIYASKQARYQKLGFETEENSYVGIPVYNLTEWAMVYQGKRYYLLFDYKTGVWVRVNLLKDVFESDIWPWVSWATHEDKNVFWSKAPCDDVRPVADALDIMFNQTLDNWQKQTYGQRGYDPDMIPDPSELEWRPDGLVRITPKNKGIKDGIFTFETPTLQGHVDFFHFLDSYIGRKSGITPETPGTPEEEQKVGIYFARLQEKADLLGLYNKSYREAQGEKGLRYAWGLKEHANEQDMIKMIGELGIEWDKEKKKIPTLDIDIEGGSAEVAANEAKAKKRENTLLMISKDPELRITVNRRWRTQETLRHGEYEDDEIKIAMSPDDTDIELLSEASQSIQKILAGETPKLNYGANTAFIQKIVDFAFDKDMEEPVRQRLVAYAMAHQDIAIANMRRKAMGILASRQEPPPEKPKLQMTEEIQTEEPTPGTMRGTMKSGQEASNILQGKSAIKV